MIIDSSALIAILRDEPDGPACFAALLTDPARRISAANYFETALIVDRLRDPVASNRFDEFMEAAAIIVEPVTGQHARIAREAYRNFGKNSGHPARLNFGDCFAYALAKEGGEPLLFIGRDFSRTDVAAALK